MTDAVLVTAADAPSAPRDAGAGRAVELLVSPAGGGDAFDARVSLVTLEASGPLAPLAGHERLLVSTRGTGLTLHLGEEGARVRLRRLEVQRLGGAERVHAELDDGPAALLNVTTRPERVRATVEVLRLGTRRARVALDGGEALLHVPAGELVARVSDEEEPFELAAGESLRLRGLPPGAELELAGEARGCEAVVVALTPAQGRR